MEWSKIKTILIFIFLIVNAFLFTMYFKGIYKDTNLNQQVVEDTVSILARNNVSVDKSVMPKTHSNAKICNVENKYSTVSKMLDAARSFSKQNNVDYLNKERTDIHGNTFTCLVNETKPVSNYVKYAKKEMKKTGLLENADYSTVEKDGYLFFYLKFEDKIFYDSYIRVKTTENGIQEIYGNNWLGDSVTEGGMAETVSPAEILINFATRMNFDAKVDVDSIESGYYIGNRDETVRVTAFPVWKISLKNGDVYYYDMRNGDLLNNPEE